jgi:serine/threonine protein kinase
MITHEPGSEIAGYRIESLIGLGGMAVVYRAEDMRLGRKVALKLLSPQLADSEQFRQRFIRESRLAASLDHPNIVPVYEAGEADGQLFIAMRYVVGHDLKGLMAEQGGQLPADRTVRLFGQIGAALDASHRAGLVHRDVKPGNILIAAGERPRHDRGEHVYLTDFGLTKRTSELSAALTGTGHFLGTVDYVSPEQIQGKRVGPATDIYALGCVLHECLTGQLPFRRDDEAGLLWAHLVESPPPVTAIRPELPTAVNAVVARAMAKEPADRYESADELLLGLEQALSVPPTESPTTGRPLADSRQITVVSTHTPAEAPAPSPGGRENPGPRTVRRSEDRTVAARSVARAGSVPAAAAGAQRPAAAAPSTAPAVPAAGGDVAARAGEEPSVLLPTGRTGEPASRASPPGGLDTAPPRSLPPGGLPPEVAPPAATGTGSRRNWWIALVAGLVVLALAGAGAVVYRSQQPPSQAHGGAPRATSPPAPTTSAPSPTLSPPRPVEVPGTASWTATGVSLTARQQFVVHASGGVSFIQRAAPVGPDGDSKPHPGVCVLPGPNNHAGLIGRISVSGTPFLVGSNFAGPANQSGELFLGINDVGVDNNSGAFAATVQVAQP